MDQAVRDIVLRHGFNATAYQILNPGMEYWVQDDAAVGFLRCGRRWLAGGGPVCALEKLPEVVDAFEAAARREKARVCYVCASARMRDIARRHPTHAVVAMGAEPIWNPADWAALVETRSSIRSQLRRAENKGVTIERWDSIDGEARAVLADLLEAWLASRPMPRLGFLTGADALDAGVADRLVFVALRDKQPVAYLLASPVTQRRGWLAEQIVRRPDAPNGTAELLIDAAMRFCAARGDTYLTLGLVALAEHAHDAMRQNPAWIRLLFGWGRAHGRRFYHFDGLENFRTKLAPAAWEPVFAISNERHFSLRTLYAIAAAFTHGHPLRVGFQALNAAIKREARWAVGDDHD